MIVQTFQPDATPFAYAVRHDVAGFLAHELARREELAYPPFHILCHSSSRDLTRATSRARSASCATPSTRPRPDSSGPRRSSGCAAAIALSCWRRRVSARVREPRGSGARSAAPAMRRDGLSAVVDVDPQSL